MCFDKQTETQKKKLFSRILSHQIEKKRAPGYRDQKTVLNYANIVYNTHCNRKASAVTKSKGKNGFAHFLTSLFIKITKHHPVRQFMFA